MAMTSEPSRRAYEGSSLFVKYLEDMLLSEEPWNCCRWENQQEDENGMVLKALSRGQPILWKNGAMNSRGLKLPVLPAEDFVHQVEFFLQHLANPAAKLAAKSSRLPQDQQVNISRHSLFFFRISQTSFKYSVLPFVIKFIVYVESKHFEI